MIHWNSFYLKPRAQKTIIWNEFHFVNVFDVLERLIRDHEHFLTLEQMQAAYRKCKLIIAARQLFITASGVIIIMTHNTFEWIR